MTGGNTATARGSRDEIEALVRGGQADLVDAFEELEGGRTFAVRSWERPAGGGMARVLDGGEVFERGSVDVSVVRARTLPEEIREVRGLEDGLDFYATGISMVLHPRNPHVPAFHADFRYFEAGDRVDWWYGGGADLTPAYPQFEDVRHFHAVLGDLCDRHPVADHARFKEWCDEYFWIPHRDEMRGVGGIFFDYLTPDDVEQESGEVLTGWEAARRFMEDGISTLHDAYLPLVRRRMNSPWGPRERQWQLLRRGRSAEFDLVHDRGTRFGIQGQADFEAILMSLPPLARWTTDELPDPGSAEHRALAFFQPRNWLAT